MEARSHGVLVEHQHCCRRLRLWKTMGEAGVYMRRPFRSEAMIGDKGPKRSARLIQVDCVKILSTNGKHSLWSPPDVSPGSAVRLLEKRLRRFEAAALRKNNKRSARQQASQSTLRCRDSLRGLAMLKQLWVCSPPVVFPQALRLRSASPRQPGKPTQRHGSRHERCCFGRVVSTQCVME